MKTQRSYGEENKKKHSKLIFRCCFSDPLKIAPWYHYFEGRNPVSSCAAPSEKRLRLGRFGGYGPCFLLLEWNFRKSLFCFKRSCPISAPWKRMPNRAPISRRWNFCVTFGSAWAATRRRWRRQRRQQKLNVVPPGLLLGNSSELAHCIWFLA